MPLGSGAFIELPSLETKMAQLTKHSQTPNASARRPTSAACSGERAASHSLVRASPLLGSTDQEPSMSLFGQSRDRVFDL